MSRTLIRAVILSVFMFLPLLAQAAEVTLSWRPSPDTDIGGYKIHYGLASGIYTAAVDVGQTTSAAISGLDAGRTYYFAASAYNSAGVPSVYSNEVSHQVPAPNAGPTTPAAPAGPASGLLETAYSYSTSATDPEGHSLQYRFDWGDGSVSDWGADSHGHSWTAPGQYQVKAQARDILEALSEWSAYSTVSIASPVIDSDGDGLSDELENHTYSTDPGQADSDGDGIPDGQEAALWGEAWNADLDGDGVVNLLDWDADGDGFSDGEEVAKQTDPADRSSKAAALPMEAGAVKVDHNWKKVSFGRQFFNPVVVAAGFSSADLQAATVRIRNVTASGFEIRIQEWDCYDGVHARETVGYLAVESGVHTIDNDEKVKVEAGRFVFSQAGGAGYKGFEESFPEAPVVMAAVTTLSDPAAVEVRLDNITTEGFEICLQEQQANPQDHGAEMIAYIAWPPSSGAFDGLSFEVGRTPRAVGHKFTEISFSGQHTTSPVFLGQMQSRYGADTSGVRWRGKDADGVKVKIAEETSFDKEINHVSEVVGYMAFSPDQ